MGTSWGLVHSFRTLLEDLATLTKNRIPPKLEGVPSFDMLATPTPPQLRCLLSLEANFASRPEAVCEARKKRSFKACSIADVCQERRKRFADPIHLRRIHQRLQYFDEARLLHAADDVLPAIRLQQHVMDRRLLGE